MALIESLYEHIDQESEFVVLCRDELSRAFLKSLPMPQIRPLAMHQLLAADTAATAASLAARLLMHLHAADRVASLASSHWLYLDPCSYLVGPPLSAPPLGSDGAGESLVCAHTLAEGASRPSMILSRGDAAACAVLEAAVTGGALAAVVRPDAQLGVHRGFGPVSPSEQPPWMFDMSTIRSASPEITVLGGGSGEAVCESTLRRHGAQYAEALARAGAWAQSCEPSFCEHFDVAALSQAHTQGYVIPRGMHERFGDKQLGLRRLQLSPEWDAFVGRQVLPEVPLSGRQTAAVVRMPPVSRLPVTFSKQRSPAGRIRVSALVSTYAAERFIAGCLQDLVAQTLFDKGQLEIVVVDSASPQGEAAVVAEFMDQYPNIAYLRSPQREGVYMAWNRAARVACGAYYTNANTDDRHRRDALEVLADALDADPGVGLVYGDSFITRCENARFDSAPLTACFAWPAYTRDCNLHGAIVGPQPMWRRELHDQVGYFDARYQVAADYEMWLRFTGRTGGKHIDEVVGLYLEAEESVEHANQHRCALETRSIRQMYARRAMTDLAAGRYPSGYLRHVSDADRALQARFG
jgi:hypothetical protein